jgi:hypothetical protein
VILGTMKSMRITSTTLLLFASLLLLLSPGAKAAPVPAPIDCPAPVAKADLPDLVGAEDLVGYTVVSGTTPVPFSVDVLGVEDNAWEPDDQILIARGSGPAIDAAGGAIASGMSGSPIYTADGRLVGALAYGFSMGPNDIMGITPAYAMYGDNPPVVPASAPQSNDRSLVSARMEPLPTPMVVSGLRSGKISEGLNELAAKSNIQLIAERSGASSARSSLDSPGLEAAGVLAGSLAKGRTSLTGIGTVTTVCGDRFLGFGHPFLGDPNSRGIVSDGQILTMVNDPTLGSYKYGVAGETVGLMDIDNTYAIGGSIGGPVPTIPVTGKVYKRGTTESPAVLTEIADMPINNRGFAQEFIPFAAATAVVNESYKLDDNFYSLTTTRGLWTIKGQAKDKKFSWTRSDVWSGGEETAAVALMDDLDALIAVGSFWSNQELEINSVSVNLEQSAGEQYLAVKDLAIRQPGQKAWSPVVDRKAVLDGQSDRFSVRLRMFNTATGKTITKTASMKLRDGASRAKIRFAQGYGNPYGARTISGALQELKKSNNSRLLIKSKKASGTAFFDYNFPVVEGVSFRVKQG